MTNLYRKQKIQYIIWFGDKAEHSVCSSNAILSTQTYRRCGYISYN